MDAPTYFSLGFLLSDVVLEGGAVSPFLLPELLLDGAAQCAASPFLLPELLLDGAAQCAASPFLSASNSPRTS